MEKKKEKRGKKNGKDFFFFLLFGEKKKVKKKRNLQNQGKRKYLSLSHTHTHTHSLKALFKTQSGRSLFLSFFYSAFSTSSGISSSSSPPPASRAAAAAASPAALAAPPPPAACAACICWISICSCSGLIPCSCGGIISSCDLIEEGPDTTKVLALIEAWTLGAPKCTTEPSSWKMATSSMPGIWCTPRRFRVDWRRLSSPAEALWTAFFLL